MTEALKKLQDEFQRYLLGHETTIKRHIELPQRDSISNRLAVYGKGYRIRLRDCLSDDFPALQTLVGHTKFAKLCEQYIDAFPSHYRSLRYYGNDFVDFISETTQSTLYTEMTQFEWALIAARDMPLAATSSSEHLKTISPDAWPTLQFCIQPSAQLIKFEYNVGRIWNAVSDNKEIPEIELEPQNWIIWRKQTQARFTSLSALQAKVAEAITAEHCFAILCQMLLDDLPEADVPTFLLKTLIAWIDDELITIEVSR